MACVYTYKGKDYSYAEFAAALHDGLLNELIADNVVSIDGIKYIAKVRPAEEGGEEPTIGKSSDTFFNVVFNENLSDDESDRVLELFEEKTDSPEFYTSEAVDIQDYLDEDVPKQDIVIKEDDNRPEAQMMAKLRVPIDFLFGKRVGIGMSDTLTTGEREVDVMDTKTGNISKAKVREEGGIGYTYKSLIDFLNGKKGEVYGWAAVGKQAGSSMISAAEKATKIKGRDLKDMYISKLNLTQEQISLLERKIPDNKEYGIVAIYKMGDDGIKSNEAYAREAFRLIDTKLNDKEKKMFFSLVKERLVNKVTWKYKSDYVKLIEKAKNFNELEDVLHGKDSVLPLDTKTSIIKAILSDEDVESKKNQVGKFLKDRGISYQSVSRNIEEPIMDGIGKGQIMTLIAIDPKAKVIEDTNRERHKNYPYGVPGFPIGLLEKTAQFHHLSPEMMDTFVKTATAYSQSEKSKEGKKIKLIIEKAEGSELIKVYEENKVGTKKVVQPAKDVNGKPIQGEDKNEIIDSIKKAGYIPRITSFQSASDGLFYAEEGSGAAKVLILDKKGNPISGKSIDELSNKLRKSGINISKDFRNQRYTQKINGTNFGNLLQKAKKGIINIYQDPKITAQQKLVKVLQKAFPGIVVESSIAEYESIQEEFREAKLLNKDGKAYGFIYQGRVFLDPVYLNNNTPIHEFGHVWNFVAKNYRPDIYNKGVSLIKDGKYQDFVLSSKQYVKVIKNIFGDKAIVKDKKSGKNIVNSEFSNYQEVLDYVYDEALAKAIGDKGELIVNESQRRNFTQWLSELYNALKNVFGFKGMSPEQIQNMNLSQFTDNVVKELLGGKEISSITSEEIARLSSKNIRALFQMEEGAMAEEVSVLITPATVRSFDRTTERIKRMSLEFDSLIKQYEKTKSPSIKNRIDRLEKSILEESQKQIQNDIENIEGVSVEFGKRNIGLWDGKYEPSFTMSISFEPQADTQSISNVLFDFAERYSQDAFIIESQSDMNKSFSNSKINLPLSEIDDNGLMNYPQIVFNFEQPISDENLSELTLRLKENGVDAFTINNERLKVSVLTFLSEEQEQKLNEDEKYQEKLKQFKSKSKATTKSVIQILGRNALSGRFVDIRRSDYKGAINEGSRTDQTRKYERSDVFKAFKKPIKTILETDQEIQEYVDGIRDLKDKESRDKLAKRLRDKKIKGALSAVDFGLTTTIYNGALEFMASQVEKGTKLGNAIANTLKWIDERMGGSKWNKGAFAKYVNDTYTMRIGGVDVDVVRDDTKETADIINGFYSDIEQRVLNQKAGSKSATDWLGIVGKGDEAVFTGVMAFLEGKDPNAMVSKQEILDYMKDNRISVVEVVKETKLTKEDAEKEGFKIEQRGDSWVAIAPNDSYDFLEMENATLNALLSSLSEWGIEGRTSDTEYSQYQLEGEKSNYKEVLVVLPGKEEKNPLHNKRDELAKKRREAFDSGNYDLANDLDDKISEITKQLLSENSINATGEKALFKSTHFDEPNILVHLRMNTRTDATGAKVLFLEEIQSDWGQTGKKEGFKSADKDAELKKLQEEARMATFDFNQIEEELDRQYEEKKRDGESRSELRKRDSDFNKLAQQYIPAEQRMLEARRAFDLFQVENRSEVPTAPFVMDTNAWVKLGLKVALKEAVAQGADKIAWTTGEQQNDRYDLSKQVDDVYTSSYGEEWVGGKFEKRKDVEITIKGGEVKKFVVDNTGKILSGDFVGERLDNVIGKEMAEKILSAENDINFGTQDLKVGGKGMKGFYGSIKEGTKGIVGGVAEALFGVKIGEVKINYFNAEVAKSKLDDFIAKMKAKYNFPENGRYSVLIKRNGTEQEIKTYIDLQQDYQNAEKTKSELGKPSTQPSIEITPELRSEIEKGLPLFGAIEKKPIKTIQDATQKREITEGREREYTPTQEGREATEAGYRYSPERGGEIQEQEETENVRRFKEETSMTMSVVDVAMDMADKGVQDATSLEQLEESGIIKKECE